MTQATSVRVMQGRVAEAEARQAVLNDERTVLVARIAEIDASLATLDDTINDLNTALAGVNGAPSLVSIAPGYFFVGASSPTLTVTGTGFLATSVIYINDVAMATTYVSATSLTCAVLSGDLSESGDLDIKVISPEPGGGATSSYTAPIIYGQPSISTITPTTIAEGSGDSLLLISGSRLGADSVIFLNGEEVATTMIGPDLRCTVPEALLADAAIDVDVYVWNPAPGGGSSPSVVLDVV